MTRGLQYTVYVLAHLFHNMPFPFGFELEKVPNNFMLVRKNRDPRLTAGLTR